MMKKMIWLLLIAFLPVRGTAQSWTAAQLAAANTAKDIKMLNPAEREAIMYLNLARLYPQQFASQEVEGYMGAPGFGDYLKGSGYKRSLLATLEARPPVKALLFDEGMYEEARCFAAESGKTGQVGHERKQCKATYLGECCSYGMQAGKDIALQWLVDNEVPSLGHRKICLDGRYAKVGISTHAHEKYRYCAVADFTD